MRDTKDLGNPSTKRDKKRDEAMERDDAAAARKAENRRLAKLEEEEMANLGEKEDVFFGE